MKEPAGAEWGPRFLDATASAFLARRLQHQRLRAAAVRGLKAVSPGPAGVCRWTSMTPPIALPNSRRCWRPRQRGRRRPAPGRAAAVPPLVHRRHDRRLARRRAAVHPDRPPARGAAPRAHRDPSGVPFPGRERRARVLSAGRRSARADGLHGQDRRAHHPDAPRPDRRGCAAKRRAMVAEILASTWRACTEADPDRPDAPAFRADVIVANPPSYGHLHCAEALHVPLHMIFTMPWSPTVRVPAPVRRPRRRRGSAGAELPVVRGGGPAHLERASPIW